MCHEISCDPVGHFEWHQLVIICDSKSLIAKTIHAFGHPRQVPYARPKLGCSRKWATTKCLQKFNLQSISKRNRNTRACASCQPIHPYRWNKICNNTKIVLGKPWRTSSNCRQIYRHKRQNIRWCSSHQPAVERPGRSGYTHIVVAVVMIIVVVVVVVVVVVKWYRGIVA